MNTKHTTFRLHTFRNLLALALLIALSVFTASQFASVRAAGGRLTARLWTYAPARA